MPVESRAEFAPPVKLALPIFLDNGDVNPRVHGRRCSGRGSRKESGAKRRITYASADTFWGRCTGMVVLEPSESRAAVSGVRGGGPVAPSKIGLNIIRQKRRKTRRRKRGEAGELDYDCVCDSEYEAEDDLTLSPL
jgi:hypothetical protein